MNPREHGRPIPNLRLAAVGLLVFVACAAPATAQTVPPASPGPSNPIVRFQANGFGYQFDQRGNSTSLYDMGSGMTGYTSKDSNGRITSQGTIYNGLPGSTVLPIPPPIIRPAETQPYR